MEWLNLNAMTPETYSTTHYFWGQAHNHDLDKPEVTEFIFREIETAFKEDQGVLEEQQKSIAEGVDRPEVNTLTEAGSLHAVRVINRLLKEQTDGHGKPVVPSQLAYGPHW